MQRENKGPAEARGARVQAASGGRAGPLGARAQSRGESRVTRTKAVSRLVLPAASAGAGPSVGGKLGSPTSPRAPWVSSTKRLGLQTCQGFVSTFLKQSRSLLLCKHLK